MLAVLRRMIDRGRAYKQTFNADDGTLHRPAQIVLADLRRFCYHNRSTIKVSQAGTVDPLAMAVAEGRREVFMRIVEFLNLDEGAIGQLKETTLPEESNNE